MTSKETNQNGGEDIMEGLAEELDVVFDLADLVRLHKGICYAAFEDAIDSYGLDIQSAASTFLPELLRDELVQQYYEEVETKKASE